MASLPLSLEPLHGLKLKIGATKTRISEKKHLKVPPESIHFNRATIIETDEKIKALLINNLFV